MHFFVRFFHNWPLLALIWLIAGILLIETSLSHSVTISEGIDQGWETGVLVDDSNSTHGQAGIIIRTLPAALGLAVGDSITLATNDTREITKLPTSTGPLWQVWLEGDALDPTTQGAGNSFTYDLSVTGGFATLALLSIVLAISALATLAGASVLQKITRQELSTSVTFSTGFFIGIAWLLLVWRALGSGILAADVALLFTLLSLFFIAIFYRKSLPISAMRGALQPTVAAILTVVFFLLCYWVVPTYAAFDLANPHMPLGPFEAGRYANVAGIIAENNSIPTLQQSYGHSILSAIPLLLGLPHPQLALLVWLAVAMVAGLALTYGLLQLVGIPPKVAILGTLIVAIGSPRLTLLVVAITDNHSTPLLYNAYADTLLSLGALFSLLGVLLTRQYSTIGLALVALLMATLWSISGFHFLLSAGAAIGLAMLWLFLRRDWQHGLHHLVLLVAIAVGAIIALPFGGMLTPDNVISNVLFPGLLMPPADEAFKVEFISASMMNFFYDPLNWFHKVANEETLKLQEMPWFSPQGFYESVFLLEKNLWDLARSLFFIIVGFAALGASQRCAGVDAIIKYRQNFLAVAVVGTIIIGLLFANFLIINDVQWELLRFMNAGYYGGMVIFAIAMMQYLGTAERLGCKLVLLAVIAVSAMGPSLGIALQVKSSYGRLNLTEKLNFMTSLPVFSGTYQPSQQDRCQAKRAAHSGKQVVKCQ